MGVKRLREYKCIELIVVRQYDSEEYGEHAWIFWKSKLEKQGR